MRSLYNSSMGVLVLNHHHRLSTAIAFSLLFLVSSVSSKYVLSFATLSKASQLSGGLQQEKEKKYGSEEMEQMMNRRRLGRLGSAPPTCKSKCGRCVPCKPVHVPIQPGRSMTLEYYPEAWRCKCGNKLFMP